jgi:chromosome segregation ATPase
LQELVPPPRSSRKQRAKKQNKNLKKGEYPLFFIGGIMLKKFADEINAIIEENNKQKVLLAELNSRKNELECEVEDLISEIQLIKEEKESVEEENEELKSTILSLNEELERLKDEKTDFKLQAIIDLDEINTIISKIKGLIDNFK